MRNLAARFANTHFKAKQFSIDNIDDFAGKRPFLASTLKFIYNSFKYKNNSLINLIISIIEDCYCNSYKKDNQNELKLMLLEEFIKLPEERIIQYLRKDENEIEKRYSFLIKTLNTFEKNSNIDLKNVFEQFGYVTFQYLNIIQEKVKIILNKIEINHQYYYFWNI